MSATLDSIRTREQLRTFHLTGRGLEERIPPAALRPVAIDKIAGSLSDVESHYPMCVLPGGPARPLRDLVAGLEHAGIIVSAFRGALNGRSSMALDDAVKKAIPTLNECSPGEILKLRKLLPAGAFLLGFQRDAAVLLHAAALAEARQKQRTSFWDNVKRTAARMHEILMLDESHGPSALSSDSVAAALGSGVGSFFKPSLLAEALQRPSNPLLRMEPARRERCEQALGALEEGIHEAANQPAFWLFHSGIFGATSTPAEVIAFNGHARWAVDSFAAAEQFCHARLGQLTTLLRALRTARLEIDSQFEPAVHSEMIERFDWESASPEELAALPPIVVIETASYFGQASLTSFGRLLRSGLPVQVLVVRAGIEARDVSEFTPDFGYLAIAHRESFVLQSSLAEPSHLLPGLATMAKTLRPAVAVLSTPARSDDERAAWLEESLLIFSRAFPLYTYNPEAGQRWAERFHLTAVVDGSSVLTAADAAALSPELRHNFRVIGAEDWNSEQVEFGAYLDQMGKAIPYLWVDGPDGVQQRALMSRTLVNFCVDRRRGWTLFEELGRLGKPQVVPDENARQQGAREAIQKVIALLTA
jgi:hypothetical protein